MKKDIVVLGIHDGHNASAALVKNGSVLAAIQEERLVNEKNYSSTPTNSIRKVFEIANIHPSEVDLIAIASLVRIITSNNPVVADTLGAPIMSFSPNKIGHLRIAEKEGLGTTNLEDVQTNKDWRRCKRRFHIKKTFLDRFLILPFKSTFINMVNIEVVNMLNSLGKGTVRYKK